MSHLFLIFGSFYLVITNIGVILHHNLKTMEKIINGKLNGISPYYYAFNLCCNICSVLGENSDLQKEWIIKKYKKDKTRLSKLGKEYRNYFNKVDEEYLKIMQ